MNLEEFRKALSSDATEENAQQMSTRLMTTISMGSKPQQSSRRLTGHGLCISTEIPIIGSIGS